MPTDSCYRCGYNLIGIADDQPCPECGLLAVRSRRSTDELHQTRPRWLRTLSLGIWIILLAGLAPVALYAAGGVFLEWLGHTKGFFSFLRSLNESTIVLFPLYVAALLLLLGIMLLSVRENYPPADLDDRGLRIFLRFSSLAPLIALAFLHLNVVALGQPFRISSPFEPTYPYTPFEFAAVVTATVGATPLPILIGLRLRSLAKRARSAHLAEHCVIVGIGVALTLVYLFAYAMIQQYGVNPGITADFVGGQAWFVTSLVASVLAGLMLLWNVYLLIRFAIAFGSAARALRKVWRRDDRSVVAIGVSA